MQFAPNLILVPLFNERSIIAAAIERGHHVLLPLGNGSGQFTGAIKLPRIERKSARHALIEMGLSDERAESLAVLARRSLSAFRQKLARNPELLMPEWAKGSVEKSLITAFLIGAWDEAKDADRDVVSRLACVPYAQVCERLTYWSTRSDPPIRHIGSTWFVVSKMEAWTWLTPYITQVDMENFEEIILDVLRTDPRKDIPYKDWWMASILEKPLPYSSDLREGLADTLALMAARSDIADLSSSRTAAEWAKRIVGRLLRSATGVTWASLSELLPLLAEAAPSCLLDAVDEGLSGDEPVLKHVFADSKADNNMSSPHTGLLWALHL
jgi:hypothetical protein